LNNNINFGELVEGDYRQSSGKARVWFCRERFGEDIGNVE
jgi:hypothetical protein